MSEKPEYNGNTIPRVGKPSGWEKFGRAVGKVFGVVGRVIEDLVEWLVFLVVFSVMGWLAYAIYGAVPPSWRQLAGVAVGIRAVVSLTRYVWVQLPVNAAKNKARKADYGR